MSTDTSSAFGFGPCWPADTLAGCRTAGGSGCADPARIARYSGDRRAVGSNASLNPNQIGPGQKGRKSRLEGHAAGRRKKRSKTELGKKMPPEEDRNPHRRPRRTSKTPLSNIALTWSWWSYPKRDRVLGEGLTVLPVWFMRPLRKAVRRGGRGKVAGSRTDGPSPGRRGAAGLWGWAFQNSPRRVLV